MKLLQELLSLRLSESKAASSVPGLGKFKDEKFIGEVAVGEDDGLTTDELSHVSFYETKYGSSKIIVGYLQLWNADGDEWKFNGKLDSSKTGHPFYEGEWYGNKDVLKEVRKKLKMPDLEWTEAGMQSPISITLTRKGAGWF